MQYPWLYVGVKVVCVDADPNTCPYQHHGGFWNAPVKGAIYEVAAVEIDDENFVHVMLREIKNPGLSGKDAGYSAHRFRPVLPDTTKQVEEMKRMMLDHTSVIA
jgi:hypothetical protein